MISKFSALIAFLLSGGVLPGADSFLIHRPSLQTKVARRSGGQCKSFPGDSTWPDTSQWESLNDTVNGRLLHPAPIAAVCHNGDSFNETACSSVIEEWTSAALQ